MDLVLDAVEPGEHHRREGEVGIGARVREAHLDAPRLGVRHPRDADRGGAVARRVGEHHRRLEAGHQALVAVGAGVGEGVERLGVADDAADVVERQIRQPAVLVAGEQRAAFLLQRLVYVHAAAVVADQRLWHEGRGLAVAVGHVLHRVLEDLHLVGLDDQRARADADLGLSGGRHLVVVHFDLQSHLLARQAHRRADVLERIHRRHRKVAALDAGAVALVAVGILLGRVPGALHRVDGVEGALHLVAVAHAVEDEELVLRPEQRAVGDPGGFEIGFRALGERARIALVALHGRRLDHVAAQVDRRLLEERIDDGRAGFGHQDHVRLVDALPSGDRGAVEHLAVAEQVLVDQSRGDRHVLLLAARVREAQVRELRLLFFYELQYVSRCHVASGKG